MTPAPATAPSSSAPNPVVNDAEAVSVDVVSDQSTDEEEMPMALALDKASDVSR
jgi:hypothetical protein